MSHEIKCTENDKDKQQSELSEKLHSIGVWL